MKKRISIGADCIRPQYILLLLFAVLSVLSVLSMFFATSCANTDALQSTRALNISVPENAQLTVSDVRIKGFTLSWTNLTGGSYEYAIAATYKGKIGDYAEAVENGYIVLDFTSDKILNGEYKVKKMLPGKEYEIKLFARKKNTQAAEYLTAKTTLPYIDEAEIFNVWFDGEEAMYDKANDVYIRTFVPGTEEAEEYKVTYKLARLCELYISGEKVEDTELTVKSGETLEVTVVNEKNKAARDYEISVKMIDNGIPVVILNTENNRRISGRSEYINGTMTIFDSQLNPYGTGIYSGQMEIRGRGNSSSGMPKMSYNINLENKTQILDMAPSREWILTANYSDKSLMRNYIAYEMYRDMGAAFSPKMRFVDLIFNGEYVGTYNIGERIKIDSGRLDLPKIKAETEMKVTQNGNIRPVPASTGEELTGSYVLEVNSTDKYSNTEIIFETKRINWNRAHFFSIKQPGEKNLTEEAYNYISDYVNKTEDALFSEDFKDPKTGYRAYIDPATFIDWYIVNEVFKNVDSGFHTSVYFYKPRGGKLCMGPVWDFDIGGGNIDYAGCDDPEGWYVRNSEWFERLFDDEAFAGEFKDRWNYVKSNYLDKTLARIDATAALLEQSQAMNFAKWKILGVYVWPNASGVGERSTYKSEVDYLKDWLAARIEWMDEEINK